MRRLIKVLVLGIAGLLIGCNQPAVMLKPPAFQSSENTVRDWHDIAQRIASGIESIGLLPTGVGPAPDMATTWKPIFVRVQAPDSAFVRDVAAELEGDILRSGGMVARSPTGATVVNLDVDFVRWGPRDKPPGLVGTKAAMLSIPAIVVAASLPMSTWVAADAAAFTALGMGAFIDADIALTPTMNAEAIWQATIVTDDRVIMKLQEAVYIRAPDIPLYAKATSLGPLASWSNAAPMRARVIRYDP
jgi:hypothetical protein